MIHAGRACPPSTDHQHFLLTFLDHFSTQDQVELDEHP